MDNYKIDGFPVYSEDQMRDLVEAGMAKRKMTINGLSFVSGVGNATIANWLRGDRTIKYSTLENILAYLLDD